MDRGDLPVTTGARREQDSETEVRLTTLIPRLTSPSRYHSELVDIWFGVERRQRTLEWDEAFARAAEGWRPDPRQPSQFALFSHPSSIALIVARQVSRDPAVWRDIEAEARVLVQHVNRAVALQRVRAAETSAPRGWMLRGREASPDIASRTWLSEMAQLVRSLLPKPAISVSHSSTTGVR